MKRQLFATLVVFSASLAQAQFSTSFEAPEFISGDLEGQSGWTTSISGGNFTVVTSFARTGIQSVLHSGDSGTNWAWTPQGDIAGTFYSEVWVHAGANTVADRVQGLTAWDNATGTMWSVGFNTNGEILGQYGALWSSPVLGNMATAATERWIHVSMEFTTGSQDALLSVDGQNFNVSTTDIVSTTFSDMNLITDYVNSSASSGFVHFDDMSLSVVPEPATMAVLTGLAALALRRKKA